MVAPSRSPGHREHQDALGAVHERGGLGEVGRGGPAAEREAFAPGVGHLQHPARAPGDLGDGLVPEVLHDLVERGRHGRERGELLDESVAPRGGLLADDGVAVVVEHRARHDVALVVGERLLELHREGVGEELDDGLARRQVDIDVVPLRCRDLGDAPLHQRLAGGHQLHDGGTPCVEIGLDCADKRRALHRRQQMSEETLLRTLEGGHRGGLGVLVERRLAVDDAGGFERLLDVVVDDLERAGVGVVDAPLRIGERVLEDLHLDPVVGERAGLVEPQRLQVPSDDFQRRDPRPPPSRRRTRCGSRTASRRRSTTPGVRHRRGPEWWSRRWPTRRRCAHRGARSGGAGPRAPAATARPRPGCPSTRRRSPWRGPRRT